MKRTLQTLVVLLSILIASRALAEPCNVLLMNESPCEIQWGESAPFSGTLMTKSTARGLADKVFEYKRLTVDFESLKLTSAAKIETLENVVVDLKVQLEDAPRPLFEQPFFWVFVGVALIGGFASGWALSP